MRAKLILALLIPAVGIAGTVKYRSEMKRRDAEKEALKEQIAFERQQAARMRSEEVARQKMAAAKEWLARRAQERRDEDAREAVRQQLIERYAAEDKRKREIEAMELRRINSAMEQYRQLQAEQQRQNNALLIYGALQQFNNAVNYVPQPAPSYKTDCYSYYPGNTSCTTREGY